MADFDGRVMKELSESDIVHTLYALQELINLRLKQGAGEIGALVRVADVLNTADVIVLN